MTMTRMMPLNKNLMRMDQMMMKMRGQREMTRKESTMMRIRAMSLIDKKPH
jgi:hypothetical protein